jgi:uncharacterized protein (TIRG00374 family)
VLEKRKSFLLTFLGVVIFAVYLAYSNPFRVILEVGRFDVVVFILAVAINYLGLFFFAYSWYLLLKVLKVGISLWEGVRVMFVSLFIVWMIPIPVGTEIIRAYMVRDKENSDMGKAIASVVFHKAYYNIAFGFLICVAAVLVMVLGGGPIPVPLGLIWFVILFAIGSSLIYGMALNPRLLIGIYDWSPPWVKRNLFDRLYRSRLSERGFLVVIEDISSAVNVLMMDPVNNMLSVFTVAFHWSTGALTAYLVSLSLGWRIDFWVIVLIYAMIEFIQQLNVFIPGGLGVIDASLTGAFVLLGVPLSHAAAISLLTRLATYWFEVLLCGVVSFHYGYKESLIGYLEGEGTTFKD